MRFSGLRNPNPGAALRAEQELIRDPARSDALIAPQAGCAAETVSRVRHSLEASGTIPVLPSAARLHRSHSRKPGTPRPQLGRAAHQLTIDATATNEAIAALSGTSVWAARTARKRLEAIGIIPVVPPRNRARKPMPPLPSRTRDAIAQLGPQATPRQVADLASVSLQAAWKALRRLNPPCAT
jgi:hypothetical protein